jgi:phosphoribosyl-ATP pyrophosphohydrolase
MSFDLNSLDARVRQRSEASPSESWTAQLLAAGPSRAARKFGEEAVEFVIAMAEGDERLIVGEAADVLYHLLVALRARGVALGDVMEELENRTAQSGLAEKASRSKD